MKQTVSSAVPVFIINLKTSIASFESADPFSIHAAAKISYNIFPTLYIYLCLWIKWRAPELDLEGVSALLKEKLRIRASSVG